MDMWNFIRRLVQQDFGPKQIVLDFEKAVHAAVPEMFPQTEL